MLIANRSAHAEPVCFGGDSPCERGESFVNHPIDPRGS
jgi:hypothetical protein